MFGKEKSFLFKRIFEMSNKYGGKIVGGKVWKMMLRKKNKKVKRKKAYVNKGCWDSKKEQKGRLWFGLMKMAEGWLDKRSKNEMIWY